MALQVPGFAGDLRSAAAAGTRAIMDYQYKSICRGEHSIFSRIRAEGFNPEDYIYLFNLRSYDRLNVTPEIKKQEEASGVTYQQVQLAQAKKIMGDGGNQENSGDQQKEQETDAIRKFEAQRDDKENLKLASKDSVAKNAMLGQPHLSDEAWGGSNYDEVNLWVQEELYIHGKLLIVDDKTVICGSSNINDRSQLGCEYHLFCINYHQLTINSP